MAKNRIGGRMTYPVGIFLFLAVYTFTVACRFSFPRVSAALYPFHVVDYSMGFCSRLLPGAVFSLFVKEPTPAAASVFDTVLLVLFFAGAALLLGKRMRKALPELGEGGLLLAALYMTGPVTFAVYANEPGFVDFYWLIFALLFLFFITNKYLYLLIVPLPALCILTHFSAMLCAIPFFAVIFLYSIAERESRAERISLAAVAAVSLLAAFGLFVYLLLNEKNGLVYSMSEFDAILKSRGAEVTSYFDYVFYDGGETVARVADSGYVPVGEVQGDLFQKAFWAVKDQILWNSALLDKAGWLVVPGRAALLLLVSPLAVFLLGFTFGGAAGERDLLKKISFLLAGVSFFVTLVSGLVFSTDFSRYLALSFLPLFTFVLFVCFRERERAAAYLDRFLRPVSVPWRVLYCAVYALTVVPPTDWA